MPACQRFEQKFSRFFFHVEDWKISVILILFYIGNDRPIHNVVSPMLYVGSSNATSIPA